MHAKYSVFNLSILGLEDGLVSILKELPEVFQEASEHRQIISRL